jgi:two-component system, chemotaxis family, protein-glutamate methylesterase/glutaminase
VNVTTTADSTSRLVAIGGSAGVIDALGEILPALRSAAPFPVLVAVHIAPHRPSLLASLFVDRCRVPVREAQDKEPLRAAHVYFAPPDYHLLAERDGTAALSVDPPVHFSRPSIDVLFESAAWARGPGVLAVALSGANEDGAAGAAAVAAAGGQVWVQDPDTASSPTLPRAAVARVPSARVLSVSEIASALGQMGDRA